MSGLVSIRRLREIGDAANALGYDAAASRLGMTRESVRRRCRELAHRVGNCGRNVAEKQLGRTHGKFAPRILIYDIETSPNLAYVWSCYDENVSPSQLIEAGDILCWSAKWIDSPTVFTDSRQNDKTDERICRSLWALFNKADIVVAHNGQAFDEKTLNARWLDYGIPPPEPFKTVDTLKIAKSMFRFPINKLEGIANYLGIGSKVEHEGFGLWVKCMAGDRAAWGRMRDYNVQDVLLLEQVYLRIRPWDKRHPNCALFYDDGLLRCVCCGSTEMKKLAKMAYTSVSMFNSYRCEKCGNVMRVGKQEKEDRKDVLRNAM